MPSFPCCRRKWASKDEDHWFPKHAEEYITCPLHKTKLLRWSHMLNRTDNINKAFLKILAEIEENIIYRLNRFEMDISSLIEAKINDTEKNASESVYYSIEEIKEFKNILETPLPISDLEIFIQFNEEIDDDDSKLDALKKLLRHSINGSQTVAKDIPILMSTVMTKSLQTLFSASGKKTYGESKRAFCSSHIFNCMEDILKTKYKQLPDELQLKLKFSRWLTQNMFIQKRNKIRDLKRP